MKNSVRIASAIVVVFSLILLLSHPLEAKSGGQPGIVNINTADSDVLTTLPGIGKVTAEKIIQYRDKHGKFKAKNELINIKGIGMKKFEKIKNLFVLSDDEMAQPE